MVYVFAVAVLTCLSGLNSAEVLNWKGCNFPKMTVTAASTELTRRLTPLLDKTFSVTYTTPPPKPETYTYEFRVCSPKTKGSTAGLVQSGSTNHTIGNIDKADMYGGENWIMMEYGNGDIYGTHCKSTPRRALVMLTCMWGETKGKFRFIEENTDRSECYYLFDLSHDAVCTAMPKKLSVGSILLIVFACVAGVYLLGGVIFQRVTSGAKGIDQIPNLGFWLNLGNMTADGCDLVCRCSSKSSMRDHRAIDGVGGAAPDSVIRHEVDDHLLPM